jgi:uncharacterized protein YwqG
MNVDHVIATAREAGFSDLDAIRTLARGAVILTTHGASDQASGPGSRLGGLPTLPASLSWPRRDDTSLAFIAQIDLGATPGIAAAEGFPPDGLLLFFYDAEQSTWGFDPKDAGSFAVIYVPEPAIASPVTDWPGDLPEHARYVPFELVSKGTVTLPPWESVLIEELNLEPEQLDAYQNLLEKLSGDDFSSSRGLLGGYPDQIQGDMMLECALVAAGLYCGDATAYRDPRLPVFRKHAREWRLLLQVPSAEEAGMMWGDLGCLYYWIREDDLKARRFDRSWMILQCG